MGDQSASSLYRSVANAITTALGQVDTEDYASRHERQVIVTLRRLVVDVRLDIRDIDMADSRQELDRNIRTARKSLEHLRVAILAASEFNVFNPVDVAQLTGTIEQINAMLQE